MEVGNGGSIGKMLLPNRIVRSATNDYRGDRDGCVSKEQLEIYDELAKSAVGLIITGNFAVSEEGRIDENQNCLITENQILSAKALSDICHKHNKKVVMQLVHCGMKSRILYKEGHTNYDVNVMSASVVRQMINRFAITAMEAKKAGFDGVQLHLSHGYLLSDFLNPYVNKRKDRYGLDDGRLTIIDELFEKVRFLVGDDFPILVKISSYINELPDVNNEIFMMTLVKELEYSRASAIELSGLDLAEYKETDRLYYIDTLENIRSFTDIPIILTGGIRSPFDIKYSFEKGADFVGFSRPFLRNPSFANDIFAGKESRCISCNACYKLKEGNKRCAF